MENNNIAGKILEKMILFEFLCVWSCIITRASLPNG